jgi:hypothetical protein
MKKAARLVVSPEVIAKQVGDETVLLHLSLGTYFGLDSIGTKIWQMIGEGKAIPAICGSLEQEYEVSPAQLERDTLSLLEQLAEKKLISVH